MARLSYAGFAGWIKSAVAYLRAHRTLSLALQIAIVVATIVFCAWAVRKEDTALLAALDEHLANVRRSAAWNLLLVKYFGEQAPVVLRRRSGATP